MKGSLGLPTRLNSMDPIRSLRAIVQHMMSGQWKAHDKEHQYQPTTYIRLKYSCKEILDGLYRFLTNSTVEPHL